MLNSYEGIVLKSINYGESDKILHIFTKESGKLTCIARGVRKSKRKDVNVDLFTRSYFQMYKGKGFYQVNQSERIDSNFGIREDIEKLSYASLVAEIADLGLPEEEENQKAFGLLAKTLSFISESRVEPRKLLISFELKFISFIGYRPELRRCTSCGNDRLEELSRFSGTQGGVLCKSCRGIDRYSKNIDESIHRLLYRLLYSKLEELDNVEASDAELSDAHKIVLDYLKEQMERSSFKAMGLILELNLI